MLSQAMKEFVEELKNSLEERENARVDPMIQKRCTHKKGAGSEPWAETVPKAADYEAVPVKAYGLSMLRGMGWKPGWGIATPSIKW
ncbi:hypothetical protein QTO34_019820 [Cnephaeus nilssonii]|uniref:Spp2/MOS2 G-patch domain-containing protein n=1 Tax=Cnephaeus nilssonii TaxID=3371016 RepID=A0AA40HXB7_CNENI|nr:hypothetical protein QTO34_019820 [Eptesicus nilssonii]